MDVEYSNVLCVMKQRKKQFQNLQVNGSQIVMVNGIDIQMVHMKSLDSKLFKARHTISKIMVM